MIAVIGSSASLRGSNLGKRIDASDIVVRCNCYRIRGYESDVGERITHWIVGAVNCRLVAELQHDDLPPGALGADEIWTVSHTTIYPKVHTYTKQFRRLVHGPAANRHQFGYADLRSDLVDEMREAGVLVGNDINPMTGFQAIVIALGKWTERPIQIAGFDGTVFGGHYWNAPMPPDPNFPKCHSIEAERRLLDKWEARGDVVRMDA